MASTKLSTIAGASGEFIPLFFSGKQSQASGITTLNIPSPPSGQRVRLTKLITAAGSEPNVTITIGSTVVVTSLTLSSGSTGSDGTFLVSDVSNNTTTDTVGYIPSLTGKTDESIVITVAISSTQTFNYSYAFGE